MDFRRITTPSPSRTEAVPSLPLRYARQGRVGVITVDYTPVHALGSMGMVNDAARILEEGIAARPVDIEAIWLYGYGFPPWRGGLLFWAGQEGLGRIAQAVQRYHRDIGGPQWRPSALLLQCAATDRPIGC